MTDRSSKYEHLIDSLYNLTVDPNSFDAFNVAWEKYVDAYSNEGVFSDEHGEQLANHFSRAFTILEKIGRQKERSPKKISQLIDEREVPSIALSKESKVVYANSRAKNIFQALKTVQDSIDHKSILDLIHEDSIDSLQAGINKFLTTLSPLPVLILLPNRVPALLLILRLVDNNAIIVDIAGSAWDSRVETTLISMYDLSGRECEVASALYQGFSCNEIAEREFRSIETVRKQVKSVLNKTQTHSQTKLMRLLTSLNFAQANSKPSSWANSQCPNYTLTLKDSRQLAYYDTGKKNSKVLIVLHGMLHDPELPECMHQELLAQGYRIIGVSRAWFGASSPPKDNDNILENNANDLIELLDQLELHQVILIGNMSGSIHALVTAALFPTRIKRVINIAGMVPLSNESQISAMPKSVKRLVQTVKYYPLLLPLLIRTAIAVIDKGDIQKLFETAYKNSPLDYALLKRDDIRQRLSRGYRFASNHGYLAYTNEVIAIATNTSQYLDKFNCKLCIIHGTEDSVNSTESIIKFSKTIENAHLSTIEGAGHLMMYAIPKTVTNALLERLNQH